MADTNEKLRRDVATVNEYARENMIAMHVEDYVAMRQVCAALSDVLNAATPPADAALADALEAASNRCHGQDVAALRKAAAALRARPQAVAEGFVMVPVEPTAHMIEEGAKSIASWEFTSVWPDSWGAMADQLREDARTAYVSMVSESPNRSSNLCEWQLTKDKDWQPSCTEDWARFKFVPASQQCPQCGRNISAMLAASQSATGDAK